MITTCYNEIYPETFHISRCNQSKGFVCKDGSNKPNISWGMMEWIKRIKIGCMSYSCRSAKNCKVINSKVVRLHWWSTGCLVLWEIMMYLRDSAWFYFHTISSQIRVVFDSLKTWIIMVCLTMTIIYNLLIPIFNPYLPTFFSKMFWKIYQPISIEKFTWHCYCWLCLV